MAIEANQSVSIDEVLNAFAILLQKSTGFAEDLVVEWNWDSRLDLTNVRGSLIWFRWNAEEPDIDSGAGRFGFKTNITMEVNLVTRDLSDQAHRDKRITRAHIATRYLIVNGTMGRMLHDNYSDRVGGNPPNPPQGSGITVKTLSIGTMVSSAIPNPERPRAEQGFVESKIKIVFPVVLKVTTDDVSALAS